MSIGRIAIFLTALLTVFSGSDPHAQAQQRDVPKAQQQDRNLTAATQAALRYVRDELRRSQGIAPQSMVVNSRIRGENRQDPIRDVIPLASLASSLGLRTGSEAQHIACEPGPSLCRLKGASAFIALSSPVVEGDSARLVASVETEYRGERGQTLGRTTFELILARCEQGWTVVRKVGRSVT